MGVIFNKIKKAFHAIVAAELQPSATEENETGAVLFDNLSEKTLTTLTKLLRDLAVEDELQASLDAAKIEKKATDIIATTIRRVYSEQRYSGVLAELMLLTEDADSDLRKALLTMAAIRREIYKTVSGVRQ